MCGTSMMKAKNKKKDLPKDQILNVLCHWAEDVQSKCSPLKRKSQKQKNSKRSDTLSPGVHCSPKQLDFQLLYFSIELVAIHIHYYLLAKLEGVLEVDWKAQIKGINEPKQHDEPHDDTADIAQDFVAFDHDSHILWLPIPLSSDHVNPCDCDCDVPLCILSGGGLNNNTNTEHLC